MQINVYNNIIFWFMPYPTGGGGGGGVLSKTCKFLLSCHAEGQGREKLTFVFLHLKNIMNSLQINQSWLNNFFQSQHFLYKGMWGGRGVNKFIFKYIPDVLLETINIKNYFFHPTPSVNFGNWRRHFCSFVWPSNLVMYLKWKCTTDFDAILNHKTISIKFWHCMVNILCQLQYGNKCTVIFWRSVSNV